MRRFALDVDFNSKCLNVNVCSLVAIDQQKCHAMRVYGFTFWLLRCWIKKKLQIFFFFHYQMYQVNMPPQNGKMCFELHKNSFNNLYIPKKRGLCMFILLVFSILLLWKWVVCQPCTVFTDAYHLLWWWIHLELVTSNPLILRTFNDETLTRERGRERERQKITIQNIIIKYLHFYSKNRLHTI